MFFISVEGLSEMQIYKLLKKYAQNIKNFNIEDIITRFVLLYFIIYKARGRNSSFRPPHLVWEGRG